MTQEPLTLGKQFNSTEELQQATRSYYNCLLTKINYFKKNDNETINAVCNFISYKINKDNKDTCQSNILTSSEVSKLIDNILKSCTDNKDKECVLALEKDCKSILSNREYINGCNNDTEFNIKKYIRYCISDDKDITCTSQNSYKPQCISKCQSTHPSPIENKYVLYDMIIKSTQENAVPIITDFCNFSSNLSNGLTESIAEHTVGDLCTNDYYW